MDTHRQGSRLRYGAIAPGIVISLAFGPGACTISAPPSATQREAPSSQPDRATARPTADAIGGADDAVLGRWRRAPAHVSDPVERAAEAACRAENAVGALPRVVVDARGEAQVTLVFATAKVAS